MTTPTLLDEEEEGGGGQTRMLERIARLQQGVVLYDLVGRYVSVCASEKERRQRVRARGRE